MGILVFEGGLHSERGAGVVLEWRSEGLLEWQAGKGYLGLVGLGNSAEVG